MPSPYDDYQKTGLDKMLALAKTLCRLVLTFKIIILAKFPDSLPIQALITAIEGLCALIPEAETEFRQWQLDQTLPPDDASENAGIDPDAPEALPPDYTPV